MHRAIEEAEKEGRHLLEPEALNLLVDYGIPVPHHHFVQTESEALAAYGHLARPLVMKVVSPHILHKTEAGGVILRLTSKAQISRAFAKLRALEETGKDVRGILLFPYQEHEVELFVGMLRDPQFGPVITFGLGGIWVEALKDVSYGIAPLSSAEAEEMISSIRGRSALEGLRGKKPADRQALCELLVRLSEMVMKEDAILAIDLNPVFPLEKGFFIADARVLLGGYPVTP